jgi:hypothetical protein
VVAVASIVALESAMPARRGPGEAIDPFAFLCWGVFGAFGIVGLLCVGRGLQVLFAREVVTPPGMPPTRETRQVAPATRIIPGDRAEALLRQFAELHHQSAILRQLDLHQPEGPAGPVALFPGVLYFEVSRRRRCTPSERLAGAVRSFAREWDPEEIPLLFLDMSWRRNGRAGILLTNRRLYSSWLDGPMELQDVTRVAFKDPSAAEVIFKVLVFVTCFLVGWIAILWGAWFPHRLVVNGQVVYNGLGNIHPNFWIDLLTTLGDAARQGEERARAGPSSTAPARYGITRHVGLLTDSLRDVRPRRQGVTALEMLPHSAEGVPLAAELVDAPSWEQVERSIRDLDGHTHPRVCLWAGRPREAPGLEIIGGGGKYALREVGDGWVYYDPNGADEEVEVQTSGAGHRCAGYYVCADVERVLRIARRFFESGSAGDDD